MSETPFRMGYVAIVGKPNVGKSTLLNGMIGQKVSIVSDKPQTTRRRVLGIYHGDGCQIAFIDTPGIHDAHTRLGKSMIEQARGSLGEVNVILFVADGSHHPGEKDREIAQLIQQAEETKDTPVVVCMNKMDQLKAEDVARNVEAFTSLFKTDLYMLTTATQMTNVEKLLDMVISQLPEGPPIFEDDEYTDQSTRFMCAEIIREKILRATKQEVPHSIAVTVDRWEDDGKNLVIGATILVEKASQRGIIIGKQGQFLKNIGIESRAEIEVLIERTCRLELHVKVSEDWRMNIRVLHELEYQQQ